MLESLARDFLLPYTHLDDLCRSEKLITETVSRLLPCLTGGRTDVYLSTLLCPALSDFIQVTMNARTRRGANLPARPCRPAYAEETDLCGLLEFAKQWPMLT